jgi:hypothetical protein
MQPLRALLKRRSSVRPSFLEIFPAYVFYPASDLSVRTFVVDHTCLPVDSFNGTQLCDVLERAKPALNLVYEISQDRITPPKRDWRRPFRIPVERILCGFAALVGLRLSPTRTI